MENPIVKQDDQPAWYENSRLIENYLKNSKKPSNIEEVSQKEKLSLLKLVETAHDWKILEDSKTLFWKINRHFELQCP